MSRPLIILPGGGSPGDPMNTVRAQQAPTVREQAMMGLQLGILAKNWIEANEPLVEAMGRLVSRLCDHVELLEVAANVPVEKRLSSEVRAAGEAARAAYLAANPPAKVEQPAPAGENLIDPPENPTRTRLLSTMKEHSDALAGAEVQLLVEDATTGARRWLTEQDVAASVGEEIDAAIKPLKIGPKPPTQVIAGKGKVPKVSDPDVPAPGIEQPPEKPA